MGMLQSGGAPLRVRIRQGACGVLAALGRSLRLSSSQAAESAHTTRAGSGRRAPPDELLPFAPRPHADEASLPPEVVFTFLRNNTFVTVTRPPGRVHVRLSAGLVGCRNAQKTEPRAALALVDALRARIAEKWPREDAGGRTAIRLNLRGVNPTRAVVVGQLRRAGFQIAEIVDTTGVPHNGCRPRKPRRL